MVRWMDGQSTLSYPQSESKASEMMQKETRRGLGEVERETDPGRCARVKMEPERAKGRGDLSLPSTPDTHTSHTTHTPHTPHKHHTHHIPHTSHTHTPHIKYTPHPCTCSQTGWSPALAPQLPHICPSLPLASRPFSTLRSPVQPTLGPAQPLGREGRSPCHPQHCPPCRASSGSRLHTCDRPEAPAAGPTRLQVLPRQPMALRPLPGGTAPARTGGRRGQPCPWPCSAVGGTWLFFL